MSDPKNPQRGDKVIDLSEDMLINVTPEKAQQYVKLRSGAADAIDCLLLLSPENRKRAGVSEEMVEQLAELKKSHDRLTQVEPAVSELAEMVFETRLDRGHSIALLLGEAAAQIKRRGERAADGHEILGKLQPLLDYQYGPAAKAVATREKAKEAKSSENGGAKPEVVPQ